MSEAMQNKMDNARGAVGRVFANKYVPALCHGELAHMVVVNTTLPPGGGRGSRRATVRQGREWAACWRQPRSARTGLPRVLLRRWHARGAGRTPKDRRQILEIGDEKLKLKEMKKASARRTLAATRAASQRVCGAVTCR